MSTNYDWLRSGSGSGIGGIRRTDVRNRVHERRTIEHLDGSREITETIREEEVRDRFVSGEDQARLETFFQLESHAAQHEMPIHSLASMKADLLRELQGQQATSLPRASVKLIK